MNLGASSNRQNSGRKSSTHLERADSVASSSSTAHSYGSSVAAAGRRKQASRRSSVKSDSSFTKPNVERSKEGVDKDSASQKRRRKPRQLPNEGQEYDGSALFTKPTSSTRARHLISRRYSPSPDTRPGSKLKTLLIKVNDKEKPGKTNLEFVLSKLPKECDSTSIILIENLRCGSIDFELHSEADEITEEPVAPPVEELPVVESSPLPSTAASTTPTQDIQDIHEQPQGSPAREEAVSNQSSDDDEEDETEIPVVRKADIGAAPFTPAAAISVAISHNTKLKKRIKSSTPVIKLPRRRTVDISRYDTSERSSIASVSSAEEVASVVSQPRRRQTIDDVVKQNPVERPSKKTASAEEPSSKAQKEKTTDDVLKPSTMEGSSRNVASAEESSSKAQKEKSTDDVLKPSAMERSSGNVASAEESSTKVQKNRRRRTVVPLLNTTEDYTTEEAVVLQEASKDEVPPEAKSKQESPESVPEKKRSTASNNKGKRKRVASSGDGREAKRRRLSTSATHGKEVVPKMEETAAAPIAARPKRLSAGKTLDFLAEVTNSRKSSLGKRAATKPFTVECTSSRSSSEYTPGSSSIGSDSPIIFSHAPQSPSTSSIGDVTGNVKTDAVRSVPSEDKCESTEKSVEKESRSSETPDSINSAREDKPSPPNQQEPSVGVKPSKSRNPSVSVRAVGAGKVRLSSSLIEAASLPSTSKHTPALLSIRRSSRSHILSKKLRDSDLQIKTSSLSTPTISKPVDPNSALGILQRVSRFTRPVRSPSPQPLKRISPSMQSKKAESVAEHSAEATVDEKEDTLAEQPSEISSGADLLPSKEGESSSLKEEDSTSAINVDDTYTETIAKDSDPVVSPSPISTTETEKVETKEENDSALLPTSKVSHAAAVKPPTTVQAGRSSRVVRPSSRFVNPDFISPVRRRKLSKSSATSTETLKEKDSLELTSPRSDSMMSPSVAEPASIDTPDAVQTPPQIPTPTESEGKNVKLPQAATPVHVMETRRKSLGKKTRPIKIKLRLGCFPRVIAVNSGNEPKAEETEASKTKAPEISVAPVVVPRKPAKRYISPWSHYTPSVKPVLGNVYYSDGTVEKLGVSVNAVMDRLLAEVCKDGITRHSAIINKREKRKRNIEKARERVARLREEKAAREALGWLVKQPKANTHPEPRPESPRTRELGPRHRSGLLQKDFLYPSLKRGTKAEQKKNEELRRARSRRVMTQLAESTYDEKERSTLTRRASIPSKGDPAKAARPREPSPYDPEKEERLRLEAEERERQKRLTMPISFNTFLSSKTSVLVAQPLLQPQRISDRAPVADHFYRELLCEYKNTGEAVEDTWNDFDMDVEDCLDVTTIEAVHIPKFDDYVAPPVLDESAEPVAAKVEQMLLRPSMYSEEDGISYLYDRALEQPELRRNLLSMAIDCISTVHVARLSACGREAAIVVYNAVTFQASRMRDVICMFSREREEAVFWMHRYLIEMLPVELLASYLFLLRHTRLLNCQVKSIVRSTQNESSPWPEVTRVIGKYVEENVVEPDAADLDRTIAPASLSDVIFVLVAPNVSVGDFSVRDRFHDPVFKWLREIGHAASTIVKIKIDENHSTSVSEMVYTSVNMITRVVTKVVREHKQKRVVLVGWGTTCTFNHLVLSSVPGVSAIIDLAFPVLSIDGPRGEPDDDILLTYCPSLFVVGSQACDYHPAAMKMMRSSMIMPSGLVVIGHANNNLLVSCATLSRLRITQRVVNRCIVEQITDFLGMEWSKRERSRLVPMPLNDIFKIDLTQLKNDEKAAQASRKPKEDGAARKKKLSGTPLQSPIPREASPSPLPLSQLDSVRSNFQSLLKKAGTEKSAKWPEERQLLTGAFKEPRLPAKLGSEMTSPVPRTDSPSLLDPASISLI